MKIIILMALVGLSACGKKASTQIQPQSKTQEEIVIDQASKRKLIGRLLKSPKLRVSKLISLILWSKVRSSEGKSLDQTLLLECGLDQICEIKQKDNP